MRRSLCLVIKIQRVNYAKGKYNSIFRFMINEATAKQATDQNVT